MAEKIRVLVVDDLASARMVIKSLLEKDPEIKVVGEAVDGLEAIEKTEKLNPDVITMDIRMSGMDGYEAVERITAVRTIPIIMVTASGADISDLLFRALEAGAVDLVPKPDYSLRYESVDSIELIHKIKSLVQIRLKGLIEKNLSKKNVDPLPETIDRIPVPAVKNRVLALAASSGGHKPIGKVLATLKTDFPAPIFIVQHVNSQFFGYFVDWLRTFCKFPIQEAREGDLVKKGTVYVAVPDSHMVVDTGRVHLDRSVPWSNLRPAANKLFSSLAREYGNQVVGVILSGMGNDGSDGAADIKSKGGYMIAQDKSTSAVFGMPASAIEQGVIDSILPLNLIARKLNVLFRK